MNKKAVIKQLESIIENSEDLQQYDGDIWSRDVKALKIAIEAVTASKMTDSEYRPCFVKGKKALFHRWADRAQVVGESILKGGHPAGQLWEVFGIIEYEDGTINEAYPNEIRFIKEESGDSNA